MPIQVAIHGLDNNANDVVLGQLLYAGQSITSDPPELINQLKKIEVPVDNNRTQYVSHDQNPKRWLMNLYRGLTGAYLRAEKPK